MDEVIAAIKSALLPLIPTLVGALVTAAVAWIVRLKDKAHVQAEVTASALRQAEQLHGETPAAEQAAADELRRMSPKVRPKDPVGAVLDAADRQRLERASLHPRRPHAPPPRRDTMPDQLPQVGPDGDGEA